MQQQWIYAFGGPDTQGDGTLRDILGGKGAGLAEMSRLGLPVPPGFTITTAACRHYYAHHRSLPAALEQELLAALRALEAQTGMGFGSETSPLLVSVRSGAPLSMPGMMDTVLNLGLNDKTVLALATESGNARFAWDSYRRFIQMFSSVVLGLDHYVFEDILQWHKDNKGVQLDTALEAADWQRIVGEYKIKVHELTGAPFPQDPLFQLWQSIRAVFDSWMNPRAKTYRALNNMGEASGTAVTIQAMVFGNRGEDCATGVAFTRNPSTGEKALFGEFLINAQGEDVVAGIRTPQHLTRRQAAAENNRQLSMEQALPEVFTQLASLSATLEQHFRDMQDIEFTVQGGKLYLLQTRAGKRTTAAALRIAVEMVREGLISEAEAVLRIPPLSLDQLLHPTLDPKAPRQVLTKGLPASPGAASGVVVLNADEAEARAKKGQAVILVRIETSPEDIHGMHAARGILTARGGMTSHAAVVARGMGRPCVSGAGELRIDYAAQTLSIGGRAIGVGQKITLDGATGEVFLGEVATIAPQLSGDFETLMGWADRFRTLKVFANAETPEDALTARRFGAEGIGLCRTEHMFFAEDRILPMREMIVAEDTQRRSAALARLLPFQHADFAALFRIMDGLPVMIRLLDPPLHEFLPPSEREVEDLARALSLSTATIQQRIDILHEVNPMLGHRGCRLGITFPEIYAMQARAIFTAQAEVIAATGKAVVPQIMVPLIATGAELRTLKALIAKVAEEVAEEVRAVHPGVALSYIIGTMIELPRAALRAGEIATDAEFFSFGSNDLTQTVFGLSRDDAAGFLQSYIAQGILARDPFVTLDQDGVGEMIRFAIDRGRATRPDIKLGICGEHGGDPDSIRFCHQAGMDYISCSPFRLPIARLAAAQAAIGG
jgi:pyruvate, orthophosphate dikinase